MTTATENEVKTLEIRKDVLIAAAPKVVWDAILEEIRTMSGENGQSMNMKLEAWPGGRWFRDLGNDTGHFWGHVQVIKPPKLLELCGPMMMSYPAVSHVQYRLSEEGAKTRMKVTHLALGLIDPQHASGMREGWDMLIEEIRKIAEKTSR